MNDAEIINISTAHDPKTGGYVVSFDAPELPERIIAAEYKPPFFGAVFVRERVCSNAARHAGEFTCSLCGASWQTDDVDLIEPTLWTNGVGDYPRYCQGCGARIREESD